MLSHREPDKARRYLDLLDTARCNSHWKDVPELVRKIKKHAPQRKCLTLTAQSEYHVAFRPVNPIKIPSPTTSTDLPQLIPPLLTAVDNEEIFPEDAFQASVCLGWVHWTIGEPGLAISRLPTDFGQASNRLTKDGTSLADWTHVCIIKGAYLRGASQELVGNYWDAAYTYHSVLPYISTATLTSNNSPEHRMWTERLLTHHCMLSSRRIAVQERTFKEPNNFTSLSTPSSKIAPFRAWARFWEGRPSQGFLKIDGSESQDGPPRRLVWRAYYDSLSMLLQQNTPYPPFSDLSTSSQSSSSSSLPSNLRIQQSVELKRVEATYEGFLLREIPFPKAHEANVEIERWVSQVMTNWRILCGPSWRDEELEQGGQEATGRRVLDILYRAATKSFHSTPILRHLFTVHVSLAEFDLADQALRSYLEIVTKSKARVEKTGEKEQGLDDDENVVRTAAEGIKVLCTFGRLEEAQKAQDLAVLVKKWVRRHDPDSPQTSTHSEVSYENKERQTDVKAPATVSPKALGAAYRAIGISQAHWARCTHESLLRPELQNEAISNLRQALKPQYDDEESVETLYSLALVLAETRDVDGAIQIVKRALTSAEQRPKNMNGFENHNGPVSPPEDYNERSLLKVWHLLALLLSARQDFSTSSTSCTAALEPFEIRSILLGDSRANHLVDDMDLYERKTLIEIMITQIALAEIADGPEEAVNASGELLGVYAKLFEVFETGTEEGPTAESTSQPSTSDETVRSLRGSIFGRPKGVGAISVAPVVKAGSTPPGLVRIRSSSNMMTRAPTIEITNMDGTAPLNGPNLSDHPQPHKLQKRNSKKSMGSVRRGRPRSPSRPSTANTVSSTTPRKSQNEDRTTEDQNPIQSQGDGTQTHKNPNSTTPHEMLPPSLPPKALHDSPPSASRALPTSTNNPNQSHHPTVPSIQDIRFPDPIPQKTPSPRFPPTQQNRHTLTLLTKIWLQISSLYRRASLYPDTHAALAEATTQVRRLESAVANTASSALAFATPGWGNLKSIAELWADVHAEQGNLHRALSAPHAAAASYEEALYHFPDHPAATVGLATILLDIYSQTIPADIPPPLLSTPPITSPPSSPFSGPLLAAPPSSSPIQSSSSPSLLAARDRAYGLLSSLTKSGRGWDCSEAWFALARAYELGGQVDRAREALWWVVRLEDGRPVRGWECLGAGGCL